MREIRTSGSEGGGAETNQLSLPLSSTSHDVHAKEMDCRVKPGNDDRADVRPRIVPDLRHLISDP